MNGEHIYPQLHGTGGIGPGRWQRGRLAFQQEVAAFLTLTKQEDKRRRIVRNIVTRAQSLQYSDLSTAEIIDACLPLLP